MKVAVWIGKESEVLYDTSTDEIVFREISSESQAIVRVPFAHVQRARDLATKGDPSRRS